MSNRTKLQEYRTFVTRAFRQPATVGAVLPTSRHVASAMADVIPASGGSTVLELGPGTGALSEAIHQRLPEGAKHVAVEIDPELVSYLRSSKPWLHVIEGDATNLQGLLAASGLPKVDAIISSIPWTLLPQQKQIELLREAGSVLTPQGVFTAITYLTALWRPKTRVFTSALHTAFEEVLPRSTVWRNVPPARIFICRRPVPTTSE